MQHGEAKSEQEDPARPLTEKGKAEVEKIAKHLSPGSIHVGEIRYSTKLRAKQTAEILAHHLKPKTCKEMQGITPNDDPKIAQEIIETRNSKPETGNLMLVGHLPHLSKLASWLLVGNENANIVVFRMGGVVCLAKNEAWQVKWIVVPDILNQISNADLRL